MYSYTSVFFMNRHENWNGLVWNLIYFQNKQLSTIGIENYLKEEIFFLIAYVIIIGFFFLLSFFKLKKCFFSFFFLSFPKPPKFFLLLFIFYIFNFCTYLLRKCELTDYKMILKFLDWAIFATKVQHANLMLLN